MCLNIFLMPKKPFEICLNVLFVIVKFGYLVFLINFIEKKTLIHCLRNKSNVSQNLNKKALPYLY